MTVWTVKLEFLLSSPLRKSLPTPGPGKWQTVHVNSARCCPPPWQNLHYLKGQNNPSYLSTSKLQKLDLKSEKAITYSLRKMKSQEYHGKWDKKCRETHLTQQEMGIKQLDCPPI